MNAPDAPSSNHASSPAIEWVRKRDGEIVRFDIDRLARSLRLAAGDARRELHDLAATELARMAAFFLQANMTGHVLASDEAAEWVEKALRETGHADIAQSYADYRQRKQQIRHTILSEPGAESSGDGPATWDKSRIARTLRMRLNLDSRRAREIASRVERIVLRGGFASISSELVREIVNGELQRWGLTERLEPSGKICIDIEELARELSAAARPSQAGHRVAGRIWRRFSLHEVVSRDVADAERRGLVAIHCLDAPTSVAASCVDCGQLARLALGSRESISQFGNLLARAADTTSRLIAIDHLEPWLALVAEPKDSPATLAALCWMELQSRLRHGPTQCVLNLYGGLPATGTLELGAGPLYSQQPLSAEREFAGAVSQEILDLFQRDGSDWPNLRIDWHWYAAPDPVQTALTQRILRVIGDAGRVAIVYDRGAVPLAEGLRRLGESVRPTLDYVGIDLPRVWRDAGSPRSLSAVEDGLRQAVQIAIRAGIQKREFMRRFNGLVDATAADSALLALFPIGLDWTVRQLVGRGFAEDEGALRLAETLVRYLRESAEREARHFALGVMIDHPCTPCDRTAARGGGHVDPNPEGVAGLNPGDESAGLRRRIHAAGRLHAIAQAGTLDCARPLVLSDQADPLAHSIHWACRNSELLRLRCVSERRRHVTQELVNWPDPS